MTASSVQTKRMAKLASAIILGIGLSATIDADYPAIAAEIPGTENIPLYSSAQARSGMRPYIKECSSCHGEMFNGAESGPALSGNAFRERWAGLTAIDLFKLSQETMPPRPDTPGKLSEAEYFAIVATILQANGLPAGAEELSKGSPAAEVPLFK